MPFDAAMSLDAVPALIFRHLGNDDRPVLLRHLLALPPECRHARFGCARTDADLVAFSASLDLTGGILGVGAFVGSEDAVSVALALDCGQGTVEIAVETLPRWRRRGLGAAVCRAACAAAAARGATRAVFEFEPANFAIRALIYALGGSISLPDSRGSVPLYPGLSEEHLRPRSISGKWAGASDLAPVPTDCASDLAWRETGFHHDLGKRRPQATMISY
jgi:GNAT superfamily N-acetyltransferase